MHTYIGIFFFRYFSHYSLLQNMLNIVPFATVGPCCLFYIEQCVSVILKLLIYPPPDLSDPLVTIRFVFYESVSVLLSNFYMFFLIVHINDIYLPFCLA